MSSLGDKCSTCFYSFIIPADTATNLAGNRSCNHSAPFADPKSGQWLWPIVKGDWWCGEGASISTGTPFNVAVQPVTPTSPATSNGTFSLSNQTTKTITDATCKSTSRIGVWAISGDGTSLSAVPGNGSFVVSTVTGDPATGSYGYTIYN